MKREEYKNGQIKSANPRRGRKIDAAFKKSVAKLEGETAREESLGTDLRKRKSGKTSDK